MSVSNLPPPRQPRFKLIPFDEIKFNDKPAYLVKGILPASGLAVVWGPPKCGKSFWTFDLVMHVALGRRTYRGKQVRQGNVVYCAIEGGGAFANRVEAFRQRHLAEQASNVPFWLLPTPLSLVADHHRLIAEIMEYRPAAVVLDTLNRSLAGSENKDEDMANYIKAADAVRCQLGCLVVVVHHCGHEGTRPRGHSSLLGALDVLIGVTRDEQNNIVATAELMKDGEAGAAVVSKLETIEIAVDQDGDPILSCVVVEGDPAVKPDREMSMQAIVKNEYLASLDMLADNVPASPGHNSMPVRKIRAALVREHLKNRGFLDKKDDGNITSAARMCLARARAALLKAGKLCEDNDFTWRP